MEPPRPLPARTTRLAALERPGLDVLVVGGGITGAGIALDLALRGLSVALVERGDWASGTSSASSRLIHGGLRYLEQLELGLVRESCLERGRLLRNAAGLVWPERFVFPIHRGGPVRRAKLLAGLALYTAVSVPRVLGLPRPLSGTAVRRALPAVERAGLVGGGSYLDAATHDARLTLAVVLTALEQGALAVSRLEVTALENGAAGVAAALLDRMTGERRELRARACVLAVGPATDALRGLAGLPRPASARASRWVAPTRGAHILVPRERLPSDGAVIFNSCVDRRVLFLIPWPRATVIGTTDLDAAPDETPRATRAEVRYLLDSANGLAPEAALGEADVIATYAGLRPLLAADETNPSARSREERVEREGSLYTIAGGKLTAYRAMAESLGARIAGDLGKGDAARRSPSAACRLRGALAAPVGRPPWSRLDGTSRDPEAARAAALAQRYGALAPAVAETCTRVPGGRDALDAETLLGEVDWAVAHEDALGASDILLRRTDLAFAPPSERARSAERVLARLAEVASWSAERRLRERTDLERDLERMEAWRRDPA